MTNNHSQVGTPESLAPEEESDNALQKSPVRNENPTHIGNPDGAPIKNNPCHCPNVDSEEIKEGVHIICLGVYTPREQPEKKVKKTRVKKQ